MESLIKLFYDWEIQLLVLLSFTIQIFLFFTGGFRWRSSNIFLRFSIWIAYLGADIVAIFALGYLSQHEDATTGSDMLRATHPLAFFWAPFLLIHLGGQDTITACIFHGGQQLVAETFIEFGGAGFSCYICFLEVSWKT